MYQGAKQEWPTISVFVVKQNLKSLGSKQQGKHHLFFADTSNIIGRRNSSAIPGTVRSICSSGCGSLRAVISNPACMRPFMYVVKVV